MKNLLLLSVLFFNVVSAQDNKETYFKAYSTEFHIKDNYGDWSLHQKNGKTNITMVLEEDFLSIHAQKPTVYKIYKTSSEPLKTENLKGSRYIGKDLKTEESCTIDILQYKQTDVYIISIVKGDFNFRYFVNVGD
jgi:hypothetical protein